jgi:hypothetical protein
MKIGPLSLFEGCIAAWHWPWSITWRWVLSAGRHMRTRLGFYYVTMYCSGGFLIGLNTPLVDFALRVQPNMRRDS